MDRIHSQVIILVVVSILVAVGIYIYIQIESHSVGGRLILRCELPTERPIMSAPNVSCPTISNCSEAKSYATQYFTQFNDADFEKLDDATFIGRNGTEIIFVHPSGTIGYSKDVDDTTFWTGDFTLASARNISNNFIEDHGGLGSYQEYRNGSITIVDEDDKPTGYIKGYTFFYHKQYNGYTIFGADALRTVVGWEGPVVTFYYRGNYSLGNPVQTQQVISAEKAWDVVVGNYTHIHNIDIVIVDLCYHIPDFDQIITVMYPAWRFSGPEIDFYVDAFTGEYIG